MDLKVFFSIYVKEIVFQIFSLLLINKKKFKKLLFISKLKIFIIFKIQIKVKNTIISYKVFRVKVFSECFLNSKIFRTSRLLHELHIEIYNLYKII